MQRNLYSIFILVGVIIIGILFYNFEMHQSSYAGLPTVECLDPTKSISENFTWKINIIINGIQYPIDASIGHDNGKCLRSIHTDDSGGTVFVQSNYSENYTLGNFFEVWKKTFNANQLFGNLTGNGHNLKVFVNGIQVNTAEKTLLFPDAVIQINYE